MTNRLGSVGYFSNFTASFATSMTDTPTACAILATVAPGRIRLAALDHAQRRRGDSRLVRDGFLGQTALFPKLTNCQTERLLRLLGGGHCGTFSASGVLVHVAST